MKIGDLIIIDKTPYRILQQNSRNFCLNNLNTGGVISHTAWTLSYLQNQYAEKAIQYDVLNKTTGIY